jgi:Pentapeptide repeats (9 copies)
VRRKRRTRGSASAALAVVAVLSTGGLLLAPAAGAAAARVVSSTEILKLVAKGKPVAYRRATIQGVLDLQGKTVEAPFECTACTFTGRINARDAVFKRTVDLSGSLFVGRVLMKGATFQGPALFPSLSDDQPTDFALRAEFTLATFDDLATFQGAEFEQSATFALARFRSDADFARATFDSIANFRSVTFAGEADFSYETFNVGATFDSSRFDEDGSFVGASFLFSSYFPTGSTFVQVRAVRSLEFAYATFSSGSVMNFAQLAAARVSFSHAVFQNGVVLVMNDLAAPDFVMAVTAVDQVVDDPGSTDTRGHVLSLIESSAKARDDLAVANDAHYEHAVLSSQQQSWPVHVADFFFYRLIAGYFVRPLNPLFALIALVLVVSLIHALHRPRPEPATDPPTEEKRKARIPWRTIRAELDQYGHEVLDSLSLIVPRRDGVPPDRRFEAWAYRILFVCILIGVAASNPTLRQMLDALF